MAFISSKSSNLKYNRCKKLVLTKILSKLSSSVDERNGSTHNSN